MLAESTVFKHNTPQHVPHNHVSQEPDGAAHVSIKMDILLESCWEALALDISISEANKLGWSYLNLRV